MTRVLHSYTDVRHDDQLETIDAIEKISVLWPNLTVISQKVENTDGYWLFLLEHWGKDTLINVEQDIVPTPSMIESFVECPHVLCTYPYLLGENNWSLWEGVWPSKSMQFFDKSGALPISPEIQPASQVSYRLPFPVFAIASALGLVKIHKSIQHDIPLRDYPVIGHDWSYLDTWLSSYIATKMGGLRWHVHSPIVKHNHSQ